MSLQTELVSDPVEISKEHFIIDRANDEVRILKRLLDISLMLFMDQAGGDCTCRCSKLLQTVLAYELRRECWLEA
ncbi:hypothetical protein EA58_12065 [Photobacterium galatheae]|uniref:Uncharacterized protein n=1 Tax=Photobacterium galatheae TaxID=1654360 RepID=A0A066RLT3_9GAMM|nr:hypothetical protein EA58_12065 [Photobacterium galatheae]